MKQPDGIVHRFVVTVKRYLSGEIEKRCYLATCGAVAGAGTSGMAMERGHVDFPSPRH